MISDLSKVENIAYMWQYKMLGGFFTLIMEACATADETNLDKIALGFPEHVEAYRKYSNESGWWQSVQRKARGPYIGIQS